MDHTIIYLLWTLQVIIFATFDTRKSTAGALLNFAIYIVSAYFTYKWGGLKWLPVPLILMPILGGIAGGIIQGFIHKKKDN